MPLQGWGQEALGGSQVASLAEPELHGVAMAVDSTVEIQWGGLLTIRLAPNRCIAIGKALALMAPRAFCDANTKG